MIACAWLRSFTVQMCGSRLGGGPTPWCIQQTWQPNACMRLFCGRCFMWQRCTESAHRTVLACFFVAASSIRSFAAPESMNFVIPPASSTWFRDQHNDSIGYCHLTKASNTPAICYSTNMSATHTRDNCRPRDLSSPAYRNTILNNVSNYTAPRPLPCFLLTTSAHA